MCAASGPPMEQAGLAPLTNVQRGQEPLRASQFKRRVWVLFAVLLSNKLRLFRQGGTVGLREEGDGPHWWSELLPR